MWNNAVGQNIRRCNRNLLLTNGLIIAVLLAWGYSYKRYLVNCYLGPLAMTASDLERIADSTTLKRYFISVGTIKAVDAGLQSVEKTLDKDTNEVRSEKVTATYFVAQLSSKFVVIKSPSPVPASYYEGGLVPVTPDVQGYFQKELLNEKHKQFADIFVPYVIDATSFRKDAYMALAISVPVCLFAAWNLKKAIIRIQNFESSPIYKWLAHYGQQPAMIAEMIEQEMRTNGNASPVRSITFLPSWLLHKTFFGFTVMKVNEIVWVYKKVTRHSVNFIPTGKTYGIVIADMSGRTIEVDAGPGKAQQSVTALMDALHIRLPWITSGYSRELKQLYQKRRSDFTEAVLARRATYQANGSASGAAG